MQSAPRYDDVTAEVFAFLEERVAFAVDAGIAEERICVDPGIGFGKTPDDNLELVRRLDSLVALGRPVVVGFSRKSTLARVARRRRAGRLARGLARRRRRGLRARRVDDPRPRRPRDGGGARGCGGGGTGQGHGMTIELSPSGRVRPSRLPGGRAPPRPALPRRSLGGRAETAGTSDDLDDTVDYRKLAALVREVFAGPERLLLEGLAGAVADGVMERFPAVEGVRVRVRKPDVVLDPPVEHAALIVERSAPR